LSDIDKSKKSYAAAVCLAAIFGTVGIHHFYLGRWAHGLFDLAMMVLGVALLMVGEPVGLLLIIVDCVHTVYFTFKLIIGEYKDGSGRLIAIPSGDQSVPAG
jgi:TM2 domain-containing membrane protein YozV